MGKGLETLKNITKQKNSEKIIYILIAAVVILIASSYIFKEDKKNSEVSSNKSQPNEDEQSYIYDTEGLENRLSNILSKIDGISNVSCFINYKDAGVIVPLYNENKEIVYKEEAGKKEVVIEKKLYPTIEGIIIVASGINSEEIKSQISNAIASVMNIGTYKIQIFNREVTS